MADEINIDLPDGPISVPAWASEDTQQKLLAEFKKLYRLNDKEVKNAEEALKNDNKNSKAQLDALKQFGDDIKSAMDGRGSLLGSMGSGLSMVTGGLTTFAKVGAQATLAISGLAIAVGSAVTSLARGFGDDIKGAGLVETGAAFGELGAQLNTLIPSLQTMGLTVDEAFANINNFNQVIKTGGVPAFEAVVNQFNNLTSNGRAYGKTLAENMEYLAEELDFRQRMFVLDQMSSAITAKQTQEVLDNQIKASQLLGKSVREISDSTKTLILNNTSLQAALAQVGPEALTSVQMMLQTFSGAGISEQLQAKLIQSIADPIFLMSDEAQSLLNQLNLIGSDEAKKLLRDLEASQKAILSKDSARINAANATLEKSVLSFAGSISDIEDQETLRLLAQDNNMTDILELLANQNLFVEAFEKYNKGVDKQLAKQVELSLLFDNQIKILKQSFLSLGTSIKAGFSPFLENLTNALGKPEDPDSPIYQFRMRMNETGRRIALSLEKIFGGGLTDSREKLEAKQAAQEELRLASMEKEGDTAESRAARIEAAEKKLKQADAEYQKALKNDQETAKTGLNSLADYIDRATDIFLDIVKKLTGVDSEEITVGGIMSNLTTMLSDILVDMFTTIMDIVGQQFRSINWLDLIFGESDREVLDRSTEHMNKMMRKLDYDLENNKISEADHAKAKANILTQGADIVLDHAEDQDYNSEKTLNLLKEAGISLNNLTSSELVRVFKNPGDLAKTVIGMGGTQEDYMKIASSMAEKFKELSESKLLFGSTRREYAQLGELFGNSASNVWTDLTSTTNQPTGTPPIQPSSAKVVTKTDDSETSSANPTSDDGTPTQSVKSVGVLRSDGEANPNQAMEEKLDTLNTNVLKLIDVSKATSRNTAATAENTN